MLTSKLTFKQMKKAHEHYLFHKRLDKALLAIPTNRIDAAKKFFSDLKKLWDEADASVIAWFTKHVEPAVKDAFDYFLTKLNS